MLKRWQVDCLKGVEGWDEFCNKFRPFKVLVKKSIEEHIADAENLAAQYGKLPCQTWLQKNGWGALAAAVKYHPEYFDHIEQEFKGGKSIDEHVLDAERLAKSNNGKLPNQSWLKNNGYCGLQVAIRNHPERFAHIEQEVKKAVYREQKTIDEWVQYAEELVVEHGKLPNTGWLTKSKLFGLLDAINNYPERFAHIERDRLRVPIDVSECVRQAEEIAAQYGKLPIVSWLSANGYRRLTKVMAVNPDAFSHIEKETNGRQCLEEHIKIAEKLTKNNGGRLPTFAWLEKNGYTALIQNIQYHPDEYAHIERSFEEKGGKPNVEKHVADAERLAKENGGQLPSSIWLRKNGYNNLRAAIGSYPEKFAHIKREYKVKMIDDHVADARKLAKKHGSLPCITWLINNGYGALYQMMKTHPEAFSGIPQDNKKGKSLQEHIDDAQRLSAENNGVLPYPQWLINNGYSGLVQAIRRDPSKFQHIPQEKRGVAC